MIQWKEIGLGDHLAFITSGSRGWSEYYASDGALFLRIQNVGYNELCLEDIAFVQPPDGAEARRTRVQSGDVLLSITADLGRTAVVPEGLGAAHINQHLALLRVEDIDPHYLAAFLALGPGRLQLKRLDRVGVKSGLNFDDVRSLRIILPPLPEQCRIAAILDKADAIRHKRTEALRLADSFLKSAFFDLVGPGATNYETWPEKTISALAASHRGAMRTGPFGSNLRHSEFINEGIAVLGIDNAVNNRFEWAQRRFITAEKYAELEQYTVFPEDVIITIMGTTGRTAVVPEDIPTAISTKHLATITLNRKLVHPQFIAFSVRENPDVLHQIAMASKGAIMDGLNLSIIKDLRLRVPPLDVQDQFEVLVMRAEQTRSRLLSLQNEADKLFGSLVQRAFRGEL